MGQDAETQDGNLRLTFTTWVYQLHAAGVDPDDPELATLCRQVDDASSSENGDAAGEALVARVSALLDGDDPERVREVARQLYGERVAGELGEGDRDQRTSRIRRYQFGRSLPWLARIWERHEDGRVGPSWLLIERVTDEVAAMDPNPWNDIDEDRRLPVQDFQVLWELDGCPSIYLS